MSAALLAMLASLDGGAPEGMVWIPPGTFEMGGDVYREEGPFRQVSVEGFFMDRHEVTCAEYAAFVAATGHVSTAAEVAVFRPVPVMPAVPDVGAWWSLEPRWSGCGPGDGRLPVVAVSHADAAAYAAWKGRRLPTEAEWEWAAGGGRTRAPRGDTPLSVDAGNTWQGAFPVADTGADGHAGRAPVESYPPNGFGVYELVGNVWEWTDTPWAGSPGRRVIKGGSFLCASSYCRRARPGARQGQEVDLPTSHLGFRTVASAAQKASRNWK